MLRIGIIGLGPDWESVYRPALSRLSQRLRVIAVYDAVSPRALRAGEDLNAASVPGMRAVLDRADVRAVLCLDESWYGLAPLRFALDHRKPVYVGPRLQASVQTLEELCRRATEASVLISPELRARTAPVTTRVQELAATRLGTVSQIDAEICVHDAGEWGAQAVSAIDWGSSLLRSHPTECHVAPCAGSELRMRVSYRRAGPGGAPTSANIRLLVGASTPTLTAHLACLHGEIWIMSHTELRWRTENDACEERLDRERSDVEVLLDHFARRVVGGLVPVAGLDDVCRILRLLAPFDPLFRGRHQQ